MSLEINLKNYISHFLKQLYLIKAHFELVPGKFSRAYLGPRGTSVMELFCWKPLTTFTKTVYHWYLTLFFSMFHFDPPENIRKPLVFCFQGDQKRTLGRKSINWVLNTPLGWIFLETLSFKKNSTYHHHRALHSLLWFITFVIISSTCSFFYLYSWFSLYLDRKSNWRV